MRNLESVPREYLQEDFKSVCQEVLRECDSSDFVDIYLYLRRELQNLVESATTDL